MEEIFYHNNKELSQSVVKEVCSYEGEGVLLIFDGFDEMPTSVFSDKGNFLMRLIHGNNSYPTCLPRATRLVTSRPSALHHKEKCFPQEYRHIEILGFTSDESKMRYAELAFKSEPEVLASFKNFMFSNPIIKSLMYIPVNCAIIAQVYKDIRRSRKLMPKTMTQLYSTLIPVLIKRYMIEKGEWDSHHGIPSNLDELPEKLVPALNRVSELAYYGLLKEDIQLVFTESDVGEGFQHLGLLSETKEMYMCEGAVSSYSFLHLSIQEFLAAWHVKCHPENIPHPFPKPELTTFGYFLAGIIGCDVFNFNYSNLPFQIMCMYEAQDCSQLSDQVRYICVIQSNPMEMYAFGYVLVHAPIQWNLSFATSELPPFDILASSLSDHASSIGHIHGSIVELNVSFNSSKVDTSLQLLPPKHLLHSILKFKCKCFRRFTASMLSQLLPDFVYLQNIVIHLYGGIDQDDYLLYELLRHFNITSLELIFQHISIKGIQALSTTLSSSCTIENVKLKHYPINTLVNSSCRIVEAAMSCPSVKSLEANIPFHILPSNHHIETMIFLIPMTRNPAALSDCLLCIAELCRVQSMKSLEIYSDYDYVNINLQNCNFLSILNDSLHQNPSMSSLYTDFFSRARNKLKELPQIIRKECVKVRRTKSLSDIAILKDDSSLQRSKSCWNILSLHNMHPLLYESFFPLEYRTPKPLPAFNNMWYC